MKSVLISIQPKWCELIASGKKTVEIRKTKPKIETPFKCYIYCTKAKMPIKDEDNTILLYEDDLAITNRWGRGRKIENPQGDLKEGELLLNSKVIGEFICDRIEEIGYSPYNHGEYICKEQSFIEQSCVPFDDMFDYIADGFGYGWHISDLVIYDKPKYINQFLKCGASSIDELIYSEKLCNYCIDTDYGDKRFISTPNGLLMCEGRFCDGAYEVYLDSYVVKKPPQSWCYVEVKNEKNL